MNKIFIKTTRLNSARIVNDVLRRGIKIEDVRKTEDNLVFTSTEKYEKRIDDYFNSKNLEYKITKKREKFSQLFNIWRFGLIIGLFLSVSFYFFLTSRVLSFEINGIHDYEKQKVVKFLNDNDITLGKYKGFYDTKKIETITMKEFDFSFVEVNLIGVNMVLTIKEELSPPIYINTTKSEPIVAKEDAIITRIVCMSGEKFIKIGQSVKKGDVLIDCIRKVGDEIIPDKAQGEIYGKVWRKKEIYIPNLKVEYQNTGKTIRTYSYRFGSTYKKPIQPDFEHYVYTQTSIRIGNLLPIFRDCYVFYEQKEVRREYTEQEILAQIEQAKKDILVENEEIRLNYLDNWTTTREVDGGKIITVVCEYEIRIDQ